MSDDMVAGIFISTTLALILALVVGLCLLTDWDSNSSCDLGPPVMVPVGNGVIVPTYPFMRCPNE